MLMPKIWYMCIRALGFTLIRALCDSLSERQVLPRRVFIKSRQVLVYLSCVNCRTCGPFRVQPLSRWLSSSWSRTCCAGTSPDWVGQMLSCCFTHDWQVCFPQTEDLTSSLFSWMTALVAPGSSLMILAMTLLKPYADWNIHNCLGTSMLGRDCYTLTMAELLVSHQSCAFKRSIWLCCDVISVLSCQVKSSV